MAGHVTGKGPVMWLGPAWPLMVDLNPKDIKIHKPGGTSPNRQRSCRYQDTPDERHWFKERVLYNCKL